MLIFIVAAAATVGLAHTAPFPFLLEAFKPSKSVWHVTPAPGGPPSIYLTFDDGPNLDWTPPLLDALREADARATFFLIDAYVDAGTAAIVKRIADEGHAIGLHSGTRRLAERLARKASSGDIVVIHDGHHKDPRADRRHAADTIRLLAPKLRSRGFTFMPLCGA